MRIPKDSSSETPLAGLEGYYQEFLHARLDDLKAMNESLISGNYPVIMKLAHKWKGFSVPYGFGVLGEIAMELEVCAEAGDGNGCQQLLTETKDYLLIQKKKG